jgi:serine/threonine protein phosphatase PrpC
MASFWFSSAKGRRKEMEDVEETAECPSSKWLIFSVMDGHGGNAVVKYLKKILAPRVLTALKLASLSNAQSISPKLPNPYSIPISPSYLRQCLKLLILSIDCELERELKTDVERQSGSTLVMLCYQPLTRQFATVNVGDSRCVINFTNQLIETKDHKPEDIDEKNRVIAAGSFVKNKRVGGILALSRALGDFSLKSCQHIKFDPVNGAVNSLPDVQIGFLNPSVPTTIVLACDGVWDVMSSRAAIELAEASLKNPSIKNPAEHMVNTAYQKQSTDNLTCLIIKTH